MPDAWRVKYVLNSTLLQDLTFTSKNEAMNYITETFPSHIRAPNLHWENLITRGVARLDGGGVISVWNEASLDGGTTPRTPWRG